MRSPVDVAAAVGKRMSKKISRLQKSVPNNLDLHSSFLHLLRPSPVTSWQDTASVDARVRGTEIRCHYLPTLHRRCATEIIANTDKKFKDLSMLHGATTEARKNPPFLNFNSSTMYPLTYIAVGAELSHNFSTNENTLTFGTHNSPDPLTMIKTRVNNYGKDIEKSSKVGLSLQLKP